MPEVLLGSLHLGTEGGGEGSGFIEWTRAACQEDMSSSDPDMSRHPGGENIVFGFQAAGFTGFVTKAKVKSIYTMCYT